MTSSNCSINIMCVGVWWLCWLACVTTQSTLNNGRMSGYHFNSDPLSGAFSYGFMVHKIKPLEHRRSRADGLQRRTTDPIATYGTQHERQPNGRHNWGFFIADETAPQADSARKSEALEVNHDELMDRSSQLRSAASEPVRTQINYGAGKQPIVFKVSPRPGPPLPDNVVTKRPLGFLRPRPTSAPASLASAASSSGTDQRPGVHSNVGPSAVRPNHHHLTVGGNGVTSAHVTVDHSHKRPIVIKVNPPNKVGLPPVVSSGSLKPPKRRPGAVSGIIVRDNPPPGPPFPEVVTDLPVRRPPNGGLREVYRPKPSGVFFVQGRVDSNNQALEANRDNRDEELMDLDASSSGEVSVALKKEYFGQRGRRPPQSRSEKGVVVNDESTTSSESNPNKQTSYVKFSDRQGRLLDINSDNHIQSSEQNQPLVAKNFPDENGFISIAPFGDDKNGQRRGVKAGDLKNLRGSVRFRDTTKQIEKNTKLVPASDEQSLRIVPSNEQKRNNEEPSPSDLSQSRSKNSLTVQPTSDRIFLDQLSSSDELVDFTAFPYSDVPWKASPSIPKDLAWKRHRRPFLNPQSPSTLFHFGSLISRPVLHPRFNQHFIRPFQSSRLPPGKSQHRRVKNRPHSPQPVSFSTTEPPITTYRPNSKLLDDNFANRIRNEGKSIEKIKNATSPKTTIRNILSTESQKQDVFEVTTYRPQRNNTFAISSTVTEDYAILSSTSRPALKAQTSDKNHADMDKQAVGSGQEHQNKVLRKQTSRIPSRGSIRFNNKRIKVLNSFRLKKRPPTRSSPLPNHSPPPRRTRPPTPPTYTPVKSFASVRPTENFVVNAQPYYSTSYPSLTELSVPVAHTPRTSLDTDNHSPRIHPATNVKATTSSTFHKLDHQLNPESVVVTHSGSKTGPVSGSRFGIPDVLESRSERFRSRFPEHMSGRPATFPSTHTSLVVESVTPSPKEETPGERSSISPQTTTFAPKYSGNAQIQLELLDHQVHNERPSPGSSTGYFTPTTPSTHITTGGYSSTNEKIPYSEATTPHVTTPSDEIALNYVPLTVTETITRPFSAEPFSSKNHGTHTDVNEQLPAAEITTPFLENTKILNFDDITRFSTVPTHIFADKEPYISTSVPPYHSTRGTPVSSTFPAILSHFSSTPAPSSTPTPRSQASTSFWFPSAAPSTSPASTTEVKADTERFTPPFLQSTAYSSQRPSTQATTDSVWAPPATEQEVRYVLPANAPAGNTRRPPGFTSLAELSNFLSRASSSTRVSSTKDRSRPDSSDRTLLLTVTEQTEPVKASADTSLVSGTLLSTLLALQYMLRGV